MGRPVRRSSEPAPCGREVGAVRDPRDMPWAARPGAAVIPVSLIGHVDTTMAEIAAARCTRWPVSSSPPHVLGGRSPRWDAIAGSGRLGRW